MSDFVHLHCHSEYSLLDGAIRLDDLCKRAKDFGMPAAAITDHGNLYGAMFFYRKAIKVGIKPIIGCEVYVCPNHKDKSKEHGSERYHLVLLAQNLTGYHNLVKLVSKGAMDGFYYKPRVDKQILRQYSEGIIALSACLAGEIPKAIKNMGMDEALKRLDEYKKIYPDRFFLEMQVNGMELQKSTNIKLMELAASTHTPLVATNDCHYLNKDDHEAHDALLCIQTKKLVSDRERMRFDAMDLYFKSTEEMEQAFDFAPSEVLDNSVRIADMCEDYKFEFGKAHFPVYKVPQGVTLDDEFRRLSREGLEQRFLNIKNAQKNSQYEVDESLYRERLEMELNVISKMGYQGYFLIVYDFIKWSRNNGVPVGPGRGSAAGSLVAWALCITNLDPIPYNLLFERFLNPERVSLPDIDVDFCERNRHKTFKYVTERYGADHVAQITTFGTMKAKAVVRDVGRVYGLSVSEVNKIAKLIPNELKMTITAAMEKDPQTKQEPELAQLYANDPKIHKLIDISLRLEGLARHASTHAAGVVISDIPMLEYVPLYRDKDDEIVSQYDKDIVEKVGLVKFDFLGLKTMTIIQDTLHFIAEQGKTAPDLDNLSLDDKNVYKLYATGDVDGIFQVESSGMRSYLRQLRPTRFEDIVAMLALYRPGPLGADMVGEFIKRKHGVVEIKYPLPSLEACLKDTYGVIVYQEQVMQIVQIVAGYTLGGADMLRRAMGKKDAAAMAAERSKFVEGAKKNNVGEDKANEIFTQLEKFADYGFNKSHSAAYALISYQTAYLKAYHKAEFMAALLSSEIGNQDKLLKYVAACADMGIKVEVPSIQESKNSFSVHDGRILFGLGGIKTVGDEAVKEIIEAREKDGPFVSLLDLCNRLTLRKVNKRVLENLIKGGAFDALGCTRSSLMAALDRVVLKAQRKQKEADSGQNSMFALLGGTSEKQLGGIGIDCEEAVLPEWPDDEKRSFEKEVLGFYLTSHPLHPFIRDVRRLNFVSLDECREMSSAPFKSAVLVHSIKEITTKRGKRMAFCQVGDLTASYECVFFDKVYAECRDLLKPDVPLELTAQVQYENHREDEKKIEWADQEQGEDIEREIKLEAKMVRPLLEAVRSSDVPVELVVRVEQLQENHIESLKNILIKHSGNVDVELVLYGADYWCRLSFPSRYRVQPGPELNSALASFESSLEVELAS